MKKFIFLLSIALFLFSCQSSKQEQAEEDDALQLIDLPLLKEKGEITAVTLYNSTAYFLYKMQPMGYEFELFKDFAHSEGLKLNIKVAKSSAHLVEMLEAGEADIVAFPIVINSRMKDKFIFCGKEREDYQVLIQRANKGDKIIKDVTELIGKEVYVKPDNKYYDRLINLNEELGGGIHIKEITSDTISMENMIGLVSEGKIPYTINDENVARLNKTYFWNLDISLKISFMQRSSWVVRKSSPLLAEAINAWSSNKKGSHTYKALTKRYFELSKQPITAELPPIKNGHISSFDDLFRKHAKNIEWDWQLLASISYQESRFNPNSVSWAGAEGLMGIMPNTAKALGVTPHELKNPDTGIRTGVDCLRRFRQGFTKVEDPAEKIKFTLAAYNAGIGHIYDAQRLAEKHGKNPYIWEDNVAEYVRLKSEPEFYNDSVCKHGYLRGSETYFYVREVLERYEYYLKQTSSSGK